MATFKNFEEWPEDRPYAPSMLEWKYNLARVQTNPIIPNNVDIRTLRAGGITGWLAQAYGGGTENAMANGGILSLSPSGQAAAILGSRSSDFMSFSNGEWFTLGIFPFNDNATVPSSLWGAYIEPRRNGGAGSSVGMEICSVNFGSLVTSNPFHMADHGTTENLWLTAGRQDVSGCHQVGLALGIMNNGAQFETGIIFGYNSVFDAPGSGAKAISMCTSQAIVWWGNAQNVNAIIRSDSDTPGQPASIIFDDDGISLHSRNGARMVAVGDTGVTIAGPIALNAGFHVDGPAVSFSSGLPGPYANDIAAGAAGVAINGVYRNSSFGNCLKVREP